MAVSDERQYQVRELAHRATDGLEVILFWDEATNELTVTVSDERTGAYFELPADPGEALAVFYHPYAHAAYRACPTTKLSSPPGPRQRRATHASA